MPHDAVIGLLLSIVLLTLGYFIGSISGYREGLRRGRTDLRREIDARPPQLLELFDGDRVEIDGPDGKRAVTLTYRNVRFRAQCRTVARGDFSNSPRHLEPGDELVIAIKPIIQQGESRCSFVT